MHNLHIHLYLDRKSTRLNSSHLVISYAVFCLKKKTQNKCRTSFVHTAWHDTSRHTESPRTQRSLRAVIACVNSPSASALIFFFFFFFLNNRAPPEISPLPQPAALPIPGDRSHASGLAEPPVQGSPTPSRGLLADQLYPPDEEPHGVRPPGMGEGDSPPDRDSQAVQTSG